MKNGKLAHVICMGKNWSRTQTHIAAADGLHHRYASSGDVIHPQLRCGSGYETGMKTRESVHFIEVGGVRIIFF